VKLLSYDAIIHIDQVIDFRLATISSAEWPVRQLSGGGLGSVMTGRGLRHAEPSMSGWATTSATDRLPVRGEQMETATPEASVDMRLVGQQGGSMPAPPTASIVALGQRRFEHAKLL
jgi:hypothetical protein